MQIDEKIYDKIHSNELHPETLAKIVNQIIPIVEETNIELSQKTGDILFLLNGYERNLLLHNTTTYYLEYSFAGLYIAAEIPEVKFLLEEMLNEKS